MPGLPLTVLHLLGTGPVSPHGPGEGWPGELTGVTMACQEQTAITSLTKHTELHPGSTGGLHEGPGGGSGELLRSAPLTKCSVNAVLFYCLLICITNGLLGLGF